MSRCGGVGCVGCLRVRGVRFGTGLRLVSRSGRSVGGWVGRRRRSGRFCCHRGSGDRCLALSGHDCGCLWVSGRRSAGGWRLVSRCGVLQPVWVGLHPPCRGRWLEMVVGIGIGPRQLTGRRGTGPGDRNRPNSQRTQGCVEWWRTSSRTGGRLVRYRSGWWRHTLTARRCECHTRPSTSRCLSRVEALCVRSYGGVCAPEELPVGLRDVPRQPKVRSGTWS